MLICAHCHSGDVLIDHSFYLFFMRSLFLRKERIIVFGLPNQMLFCQNLSSRKPNSYVYRNYVPPRVIAFCKTEALDKILTLDNLCRRKHEEFLLSACSLWLKAVEDVPHIFIHCSFARQAQNFFLNVNYATRKLSLKQNG